MNTPATKQTLPAGWKLPDEFRNRIGSAVGRQRAMLAEGHLLLVLHAVPKANEVTRQGRYFWRDASGNWLCSDLGYTADALNRHLGQYAQRLHDLEELETRVQRADQYMALLDGVSPVLRAARNMLQVLEEARKAVPEDRLLIDCRDHAYDLARTAELLYGDAKTAMDVAIVRRAEEQAAASNRMALAAHRLNILLAMFFPIATLSAMFSTVFTEGWDFSESSVPFAWFVGFGLVSGAVLTWFITRSHEAKMPDTSDSQTDLSHRESPK